MPINAKLLNEIIYHVLENFRCESAIKYALESNKHILIKFLLPPF